MKTKRPLRISIAILCIGLLMTGFNKASAQKEAGRSVITAGAGYSILGMASSFKANTNDSTNNDHFTSNPYFAGSYDIGLAKIFSLGLSCSYQSFRYYYDGYSFSQKAYVRLTDKFTRTNYGLRALFHFGKKETIDMYAGMRLGYTVWGISTTSEYPDYKPENAKGSVPWALRVNIKNTHYTAQAIFGMRYFFSKHFGFNWEVSVGPPGVFMIGMNAKF